MHIIIVIYFYLLRKRMADGYSSFALREFDSPMQYNHLQISLVHDHASIVILCVYFPIVFY